MSESECTQVTSKNFNHIDFDALLEPDLIRNFDEFEKQLDNGQPFGFIIDGTPGMAKTTNACIMARHYQNDFNEAKQLGQGTEAFIKAYNYTIDHTKGKYKVCIYDEANESAGANALNKIQKILNQLLVATSRQEKVIIIVVLHRFYTLNEKFVDNGLVHMLLHFYNKSNNKYSSFKAYAMHAMLWMYSNIRTRYTKIKPNVYKTQNAGFHGRVHAPPIEYIEYIASMSKLGKDFIRQKATRDVLAESYYTVSTIASMLDVTNAQVNYKIKEMNLKNDYLKEKSGKIFYYDKEVFNILKKHFNKLAEDKARREDNERSN